MNPHLKLRAIVLRTVDYGESDRVVTLLTAERGKLSAFARGARASRRRFGGALEPFTLLAVEARERRGAELLSLTSVQVERGFGALRGDLGRIACAAYACELARELTRDAEPHPDLFQLLCGYLASLDAAPPSAAGLRAFEIGALRAAGLAPRLDACARCGEAAAEGERPRFDPAHGGLLCHRCAAFASPAARDLSPATARALLRIDTQGADGVALGPEEARQAREALTAFIEHHLGRRLQSRRFLDEMGPALAGG
ncbi:MAG TPA: DNA repair protein RecO [Anaeromyxobacteraceae bacterium]|nr:DNA repair protein RecO [Anaeromyxobacteraceae bacterium]